MEMNEYLMTFREDVPEWLANYKPGDKVAFNDFMSGRMGYYPGSYFDGTLMKIANKAHCTHAFLYVDYLLSRKDLERHLKEPNCVQGYHSIGRMEWTEKDLMPNGQYPLNVSYRPSINPNTFHLDETPYCFMEIMERNNIHGDEKGAKRFAITFLLADGIATYYQLFCREYKKEPWIFLLQDHGFGCNYDCFGRGGFLDAIITANKCHPEFVICADNTGIWDGYTRIAEVRPLNDHVHNERMLYRRI